eukprot:TRINITY_DN112517_c0_g1_i1.p2 TRINITY_DN112517_c0_g1~~TRINITY_DN112517_c0_g1_i1.p2  ORF type:complete len:326 (-),score=57.52 TRINITY_DN112517_c0_g1_i1:486-1463(-)
MAVQGIISNVCHLAGYCNRDYRASGDGTEVVVASAARQGDAPANPSPPSCDFEAGSKQSYAYAVDAILPEHTPVDDLVCMRLGETAPSDVAKETARQELSKKMAQPDCRQTPKQERVADEASCLKRAEVERSAAAQAKDDCLAKTTERLTNTSEVATPGSIAGILANKGQPALPHLRLHFVDLAGEELVAKAFSRAERLGTVIRQLKTMIKLPKGHDIKGFQDRNADDPKELLDLRRPLHAFGFESGKQLTVVIEQQPNPRNPRPNQSSRAVLHSHWGAMPTHASWEPMQLHANPGRPSTTRPAERATPRETDPIYNYVPTWGWW